VPILTWLPTYDRSKLRFDVIVDATVWGSLVREMTAYAGLAGLPPQAGLYTLFVALAARRSGVLATIGEDRVFHTIDEAVGALTR
jgi:MFS superfamily sulfate permease-like transporter